MIALIYINLGYFSSGSYRYGFNGKERDLEGIGGGGATYDYGFRIYNPQIAKFLSVDPLSGSFPFYTPYQFSANMPIAAVDLDGLEAVIKINSPWYTNEIKKAIASEDIQRALFLVSNAPLDKAKTDYAKKIYGADYAGTYNANESNPEGLTVYDQNGDFLFNIKEKAATTIQKPEPVKEEVGFYDLYVQPTIDYLNGVEKKMSDALEGPGETVSGGYSFTSGKAGGAMPTKTIATGSSPERPIGDLLTAWGATAKGFKGKWNGPKLPNKTAEKIRKVNSMLKKGMVDIPKEAGKDPVITWFLEPDSINVVVCGCGDTLQMKDASIGIKHTSSLDTVKVRVK